MMRGAACRLFAALLMAFAVTTGSLRAEDDAAQKALDAARQLEARINEDADAPPEAYLPVARLLRDIAQRYPDTPQARDALERLAEVCKRMKRCEEAAAVYEQVISHYPDRAFNAVSGLENVIGMLPNREQRRQAALQWAIESLTRHLAQVTDSQRRCWVLQSLVLACDLAGATDRAATYGRDLAAATGDDPAYARYGRDYLEYLQTWPHVSVTENSWVMDITNADDVTPETELERKNQRAVNVTVRAPLGKQFASSLTFNTPAPIDATKPKVRSETLPDGRTQAVWQATCGLGDRYLPAYSQYGGWAVWKSSGHLEDVRASRSVQMIRPGREFVSVFVETPRPVSVEVWAGEGARIDAHSISAPVPPTNVDRAHLNWQYEPGKVVPPNSTMGSLDCSLGWTFTFEMDLPPGMKRVVPRVTVVWTSMRWALGPDAKVQDCPPTTHFSGAVGEVPYVVESETPFRVVTRWVLASASVLLSERTERE